MLGIGDASRVRFKLANMVEVGSSEYHALLGILTEIGNLCRGPIQRYADHDGRDERRNHRKAESC